jgi:hypothetical protein
MNFKQKILSLLGDLGQFLSILFKDTVQQELKVVLPIALDTVTKIALDPTLLTGGARRDAAISAIQGQLAQSQVTVGLSVVSLAVELAVTTLKNK